MEILHQDTVIRVDPGTTPNYDRDNPLLKLMTLIEGQELSAGREFYDGDSLQHLFPIDQLVLYGPSAPQSDVLDPTQQDVKTDFQKQNIKDFITADTRVLRGMAHAGDWYGPFIRLSYAAGPYSQLSRLGGAPGASIRLYLKVGAAATSDLIVVPYNAVSGRYEVELWGVTGGIDVAPLLDDKARSALARGELLIRPDLVQGHGSDFDRDQVDGRDMTTVAPAHALHPILPLSIELAWANADATVYDSNGGQNYHYTFRMVLRGWRNFLKVGNSSNPHGGVGSLEYRNLMSNYFGFEALAELGRTLESWNFDASGHKGDAGRQEFFFAVDYMDLHIVRPNCGIGLHRHRDNQEVFLLMEGRGWMVVGDWAQPEGRQRCLEVRVLTAGHFVMLKGGNLHALMNPTDENLSLFMFGGYD